MSGLVHELAVGESVEWYTPPEIFDALGFSFDLDPCSPPGGLPWIPASHSYSREDDGLALPWEGRVWMNPPYGKGMERWMQRFVEHGDGVALVFARTDVGWFHELVGGIDAVCLIRGRLSFVDRECRRASANAGAPSMLLACGGESVQAIAGSRLGLTVGLRMDAPALQGCLL